MARPIVELDARPFLAALRKVDAELLNELKREYKSIASSVAQGAASAVPQRTGALVGTLRPGATKRGALVRIGSARVPYAGSALFGGHPPGRPYDPQGRGFFPALKAQEGMIVTRTMAALNAVAKRAGV